MRQVKVQSGPREIVVPCRPIPPEVPEGMAPNEFFNDTENLDDLAHNNILPINPENLLLIASVLLFNNDLLKTAGKVRCRCITDTAYANAIRWQPAFRPLVYRIDEGRLIVAISQNSIGNAITELLGVVPRRVPDAQAYERFGAGLLERLVQVRSRLVEADLDEGIAKPCREGEG
jgi:hypothetical protein